MPSTRDYEYLLECKNVIGVDYDPDADRVTVFVSQKEPRDYLAAEDDVETRVAEAGDAVRVDVVDAGYREECEGFDALSTFETAPEAAPGREGRHRPVPAGVSESNANSTAGTAGPYPARVTDPDGGASIWRDDVGAGTLVRLSNNHVYARSNAAALGEPIRQPSSRDGGSTEDAIGNLVGYVPIEEGGRVDVAARSVDPDRESATYYGLEDAWPTGVYRGEYAGLRGETVTKTGRTTGVTRGFVGATNASVRVDFGADRGPVLLRNQLITEPMSAGGDSGSPVFLEDGTLVGMLFAGSAEQTVCNRIAHVESELGVEIMTGEPADGVENGSIESVSEADSADDGNEVDGIDGDEVSSGDVGSEGRGSDSGTKDRKTAGESAHRGGDGDENADEQSDPMEDVPVYSTTFDQTVSIDLETPSFALESIRFEDRVRAGETVELTATVAGEAGTYWLDVGGERTTVSIATVDNGGERSARGRAAATVLVSIPDDVENSLTVRIRGGPVETLE